MGVEVNNKSLERVFAAQQANTMQTALVGSAVVSDEEMARLIAQKWGVDFIRLSETNLSSQVVRLLPHWLVTQHNIIAVKFEEDTLYVAMTNPVDLPTLDQINLVTGFNVKPLVATEREIIKAISQHYGAEQMTKQDLIDAKFDAEPTLEGDKRIEDLATSDDAGQVVRLVNSIIKDAIGSLASDIHFEPANDEMVVRFRVDGILHDCLTVPAAVRKEVVSRLKVLAKLDITEKRKAQDGHINLNYKGNDYDLRVSVVPTIDGEKTVLRILDKNSMLINLTTLGIRCRREGFGRKCRKQTIWNGSCIRGRQAAERPQPCMLCSAASIQLRKILSLSKIRLSTNWIESTRYRLTLPAARLLQGHCGQYSDRTRT